MQVSSPKKVLTIRMNPRALVLTALWLTTFAVFAVIMASAMFRY